MGEIEKERGRDREVIEGKREREIDIVLQGMGEIERNMNIYSPIINIT